LDPIEFEIIFTTSYDHFAVHAFRLSAIDYLLKPIDKTELAAALEKFKERKQGQAVAPNIKNMLANLELPPTDGKAKVALPTLNGFLFVAIQDIVWCKADSAYSTFGMSNGEEVIVSKTLKEAELMLIEYGFFRIHNSHLINQHHILEYIRGDGGQVRMTGGALLEVSRRRKEEFLNRLNVK
jgi:two-component system LytT family response regulator